MGAQIRVYRAVLLAGLTALAAAPVWAADSDRLSEGIDLLEQGRLRSAEQTLREAARLEPDSGEVHFALARVANAAGRRDEALRELERAHALGVRSPELLTEIGDAYQGVGRYGEAQTVLESAARQRPDDARVHLLLGLTKLGLEDPEGAAAEFEAVGDDPPGFRQIALYNLGSVYLRAGERDDARRTLVEAAALDPQSVTGRRAAALLADTPPTRERRTGSEPAESRRWNLSGSGGLLYDDNVTSSESDVSSGVGDGAATFDMAGSYRLLDGPDLSLEAGYDFYQSLYFDLDDFNQQMHGIALDASRELGEIEAGLGYRYTMSRLGDDYLFGLHELRPSVEFSPSLGWHIVAWPRLRAKDHDDSRRDSIQAAVGADQFFLIGDRGDYALAGFSFESENADGAEFDYLGFAANLGYRRPFTFRGSDYRAGADYRFRHRNYANITPSIGAEREDNVHSGRIRLSRTLSERTELRLDYDLIASESNLPSVDYLQNVFTLSVGFAL